MATAKYSTVARCKVCGALFNSPVHCHNHVAREHRIYDLGQQRLNIDPNFPNPLYRRVNA